MCCTQSYFECCSVPIRIDLTESHGNCNSCGSFLCIFMITFMTTNLYINSSYLSIVSTTCSVVSVMMTSAHLYHSVVYIFTVIMTLCSIGQIHKHIWVPIGHFTSALGSRISQSIPLRWGTPYPFLDKRVPHHR